MQIRLQKDKINASLFTLICIISMDIPYAIREIAVVKGIFIICRSLTVAILIMICLKKCVKWNVFDMISILFCLTIFISAFHAGISRDIATTGIIIYIYRSISVIVFIAGQLLLIKFAFCNQERICLVIIKTIFYYYRTLCLINLITQIMGLEIPSRAGNYFFFGVDNEVGKYYLAAVLYCCVIMTLEKKRFSWQLVFMTILTVAEGLYREIGSLTIVGFLLSFMVLLLWIAPVSKIWNVRHDVVIFAIVGIYMFVMFTFANIRIWQDFINTYLYGKVRTLRLRFELQAEFFTRWLESPLWGWASSLSKAEWGNKTWFDYALRDGATHNYLVDALYNYGLFAFILYFLLLIVTARKVRGKKIIIEFTGIVFLLVFLRGMTENGCQNIFLVLPAVYYIGAWCGKGADI